MSGYHLCQVKKALHPYYIESISTNISTIEELCFYLQKNIYLIDETIMNERLCDWIRDELGLQKLYRKLYEQLENHGTVGNFILPVFKEIGYLSHEEFRSLQSEIARIEVQPEDLRKKMKADYLVEYQMYANAIREYYKILKNRGPGNMGSQFYAAILNNMAAAYARLFLFEEAADCLWQSYSMVRSNEVYHRYLSALALCMEPEEYKRRMQELRVPAQLQKKIQENIARIRKESRSDAPARDGGAAAESAVAAGQDAAAAGPDAVSDQSSGLAAAADSQTGQGTEPAGPTVLPDISALKETLEEMKEFYHKSTRA